MGQGKDDHKVAGHSLAAKVSPVQADRLIKRELRLDEASRHL